MKKRAFVGLLAALFSLDSDRPAGGGGGARRPRAERAEIARVVSSVIGWAKNKDSAFLRLDRQRRGLRQRHAGEAGDQRFEDVKQNVPFWMSPDSSTSATS